jgi:glycosyltransferase involved in cell wall biosynthesis
MAFLKVLLTVHQFFPRGYHGTERYTLDLGTELARAGHNVVILTTNQIPEDSTGEDVIEYEYSGLRVLAVDLVQNRRLDFAASYNRPDLNDLFARILLQERPDVVHCAHLLFLGVSFLDVARHTGCPIVFTMTDFFGICWTNKLLTCAGKECAGPDRKDNNCLHDVLGLLPLSHADSWTRFVVMNIQWLPFMAPFLERLVKKPPLSENQWYATLIQGIRERRGIIEANYRHVDHFIVATSVLERKYREHGLRDRTISRLPFGITQPSPEEHTLLRVRYEKLRSTDRPLVFGFIGQIARHKGVDLLVRSFVNAQLPNTELHVMGNFQQDPAIADEIKAIAHNQDNVQFLPPFATSEIYRVLAKIDILVIPSIWSENAPLILLNCLASRTLVAASDVAGMTEFVEPEKTALVFAAKSCEAIAATLTRAALLRPMLLDLYDSHPGYPISPAAYANQVAKIYELELKKRSRSWNEVALERIAASGPPRVRPVT